VCAQIDRGAAGGHRRSVPQGEHNSGVERPTKRFLQRSDTAPLHDVAAATDARIGQSDIRPRIVRVGFGILFVGVRRLVTKMKIHSERKLFLPGTRTFCAEHELFDRQVR